MNTGVGCHFLLQGIFPTQELNPGLLNCRQILYGLSYEDGSIILKRITSVQFSHSVMSDSSRPHKSQHARPPCPSPTPRVHPDSRPSSQWCHPSISSSVVPFSSCPQSLPASESLGWLPSNSLFRFDILLPAVHIFWIKQIFPWHPGVMLDTRNSQWT